MSVRPPSPLYAQNEQTSEPQTNKKGLRAVFHFLLLWYGLQITQTKGFPTKT